jgi:hypothetical protein
VEHRQLGRDQQALRNREVLQEIDRLKSQNEEAATTQPLSFPRDNISIFLEVIPRFPFEVSFRAKRSEVEEPALCLWQHSSKPDRLA